MLVFTATYDIRASFELGGAVDYILITVDFAKYI